MIFFLVIPFLLGKLITYIKKDTENSVLYPFVLGYILEFALLEIITVPMIFLKGSFTTLFWIFFLIVFVLSVISCILHIKKKNWKKIDIQKLKENLLLKIIVCIIIGIQVWNITYFTHIEQDDSVYVVASLDAITYHTLYQINPKDGSLYETPYLRYVLSPFPFYVAIASKIVHIHPTIIWHTILPGILVLIAYSIFYIFGKKWFKNQKENFIFLIILSFINIWGNYTMFTSFTHLLLNIWEGKSILANIILPFLWYAFLECAYDYEEKMNWIILGITSVAGCFVSGMGIILIPISLGMLAIVFAIKDKKIGYIIKSGICMIPNVILGIMYLLG